MWARASGALLLATLTNACVPVKPPALGVDPQGAPITTAEISAAMHHSSQTAFAIGLGLLGGVIGTAVFGKIGHEIGYAHDIQQGCEDCGMSGMLSGAALGLVAGSVAGGNIGMHAGARADRDNAIARIIRARGQGSGVGGQSAGISRWTADWNLWAPRAVRMPVAQVHWARVSPAGR
jgi:MFS family permease